MESSLPLQPKKSTQLAFFGTAEFSGPSLKRLIESGAHIAVVVTKPDARIGRHKTPQPPLVKQIANEHQIPIIQPAAKHEVLPLLKSLDLQIDAAIVVAYGMILPPEVLNYFPSGMINVHASLLPRFRGPSPIEAAILEGDNQTGVTLMQLAAQMDAGDIYTQKKIALNKNETRPELYSQLSQIGAELLVECIDNIISGEIPPQPQNEEEATYTKLIKKSDGIIDWSLPATTIEKSIRAYLGWPGSRTTLMDRDVVITSVSVVHEKGKPGDATRSGDGNLLVYCGKDALIIKTLIPAGKKEMTGADFLRGHHRKTQN